MPISARYSPEHGPLDASIYSCDFSALIPPGVGIYPSVFDVSAAAPSPRLEIYLNAPGNMLPAPQDWYVDPRLTAWPQGWVWAQRGLDNPGIVAWQQGGALAGSNAGLGVPAIALGTAVRGRRCYSLVGGGHAGLDYLFVWTVIDTVGNHWVRSFPVLCGPTQ